MPAKWQKDLQSFEQQHVPYYKPKGDKILVKLSKVNDCSEELRVSLKSNIEGKITDGEYIFTRIVRAGPKMKYKKYCSPGTLVLIQLQNALRLENLESKLGEKHWLVNEKDIIAYFDF